jgi:integrase
MSIQKRDGLYRVRWLEGGRHRQRSFKRAGDAQTFEADIERRRQLGPLASNVLQSRVTLTQFVRDEWLPRYAKPNLRDSIRRRYLEVLATHLLPRLGDYELREITPMLVEDTIQRLKDAGAGAETQRKSIALLSGILKRAVVRGLIPSNPVAVVATPKAGTARPARPLAPATVEAVRAQLGRLDQVVCDLIAYQGLRPGEATTARWGDLGDRTIWVEASKTSKERAVRLLDPVVEGLAEWRMASGRPGPKDLILPRTSPWLTSQRRDVDHAQWTMTDWQNWQGRIYKPAAIAAGVTGDMRAYRLRGSFASLLLWEGRSLTYVAQQAGHSVATLAKHYAGVIEELKHKPKVPAAQAIRQAREGAGGQLRLGEAGR